jgi:hypothetical protein
VLAAVPNGHNVGGRGNKNFVPKPQSFNNDEHANGVTTSDEASSNENTPLIPPHVIASSPLNHSSSSSSIINGLEALTSAMPEFTKVVEGEHDHCAEYSCNCSNIPLAISQNLSNLYAVKTAKGHVNVQIGGQLQTAVTGMVDALSNLDRILTSKIPMAYSVHLRRKYILLFNHVRLPSLMLMRL